MGEKKGQADLFGSEERTIKTEVGWRHQQMLSLKEVKKDHWHKRYKNLMINQCVADYVDWWDTLDKGFTYKVEPKDIGQMTNFLFYLRDVALTRKVNPAKPEEVTYGSMNEVFSKVVLPSIEKEMDWMLKGITITTLYTQRMRIVDILMNRKKHAKTAEKIQNEWDAYDKLMGNG